MTEKELTILKLENRLRAIESRGKAEPNCGVIKKINRILRNLKGE
jgi:hypothetical protein